MTDEPNQAPVDEKITRMRPLWTARTSLLLAICGIVTFPFLARDAKIVPVCIVLLAIVLGVLAVMDASRVPHRKYDICFAVLGIILGVWLMHVASTIKFAPRGDACMHQLRSLAYAVMPYADEHDDMLPPPERWNDELQRYLRNSSATHHDVSKCTTVRDGKQSWFAMNACLKGRHAYDSSNPTLTVMFFESVPGRNRYGGPELLPTEPRHEQGYLIAFVDGHVTHVPKSELSELNWDPGKRRPSATE